MPRQTIFISSATIDDKNDLGSKVNISLREPIDVQNKNLKILQSSIWYTFPNISPTLNNNKLEFSYNGITRLITLVKGLYSFSDINESVSEALSNLGLPIDLISFVADEATSLCSLYANISTTNTFSITPSAPNNLLLSTLLGFTNVGTYTFTTPTYLDSASRVKLNSVSTIYLNVSFCGGNSVFNNVNGSTIAANININGSPGSLLTFDPSNTVAIPTVGGLLSTFSVWLCDQTNNNLLDLNGETFTVTMELSDKE